MSTMTSASNARPRVCIVSNEFIGVSRNGGIGTAMTGLAHTLAEAGMPVTVLFVDGVTVPKSTLEQTRAHFAGYGIAFEALLPRNVRHFAGPVAEAGFAVPAAIFETLRERTFDV